MSAIRSGLVACSAYGGPRCAARAVVASAMMLASSPRAAWGQELTAKPPGDAASWSEGRPVPPGYHVERRRDWTLVLGGAAMFGGFYGLAVLGGAVAPASSGRDWLYVPSIGPVAALFDPKFRDDVGHEAGLPLGVDAGLQIGGLAMIAFGLVPRGTLVDDSPRRPSVVPAVVPPRRGAGLALNWTF